PRREGRAHPRGGPRRHPHQAHQGPGRVHRRGRRGPVQAGALPVLMARDQVLVALEGLDGAGKRTLTDAVVADLGARGVRAATLAFPRYGRSVHADLAAEALHGAHGDLTTSVYAM